MLDAAKAWGRKAVEMNPDHLLSTLTLAGIQAASEPEEALTTIQSYLNHHSQNTTALLAAGRMALWAGRPEEAKSHLERAFKAEQLESANESSSYPHQPKMSSPLDRMVLGIAVVQLGNHERGQQLLRQARDSFQARPSLSRWGRAVWLAGSQAVLGQREEALLTLEQSLSETAPVTSSPAVPLRANPFFEDLRSDSRFQQIVREVESRLKKIRNEVRQVGLDLYPPESTPNSGS